jgi:hypothetical protein
MLVHCFWVFEFKSLFEFSCLNVFQKKSFSCFPSTPIPFLARVFLGPALAKSSVTPFTPWLSAPLLPLPYQPNSAGSPPALLGPARRCPRRSAR